LPNEQYLAALLRGSFIIMDRMSAISQLNLMLVTKLRAKEPKISISSH